MEETPGPPPRDDVNQIVRDLQALRVSAGGLSYAEIVRRVTALRQTAGVSEFLARPARTTVYDAFREGRARLDADLVADIAEALGGDGPTFRRRCQHARLAVEATAPVDAPADERPPPLPALPEVRAEVVSEPRLAHRLVLTIACVVINLFGYLAVELFDLPIFLDMTGTGIAAIALGPWHGVAVALATHLVGMSVHGVMTLPFVAVNIAGALIWGYGVRSLGLGNSLTRYFGLTLVVAAACSVLATPILLLLFGGDTSGRLSSLTQTLEDLGAPVGVGVLVANLMMSAGDKLISGFLILTAVTAISRRVPIPGGHLFRALNPGSSATPLAMHTPVRAARAPEPR